MPQKHPQNRKKKNSNTSQKTDSPPPKNNTEKDTVTTPKARRTSPRKFNTPPNKNNSIQTNTLPDNRVPANDKSNNLLTPITPRIPNDGGNDCHSPFVFEYSLHMFSIFSHKHNVHSHIHTPVHTIYNTFFIVKLCSCQPEKQRAECKDNKGCIHQQDSPEARREGSRATGKSRQENDEGEKRSSHSLFLYNITSNIFSTTYALSFYLRYKEVLITHIKTQTRRVWKNKYLKYHTRVLKEGKLVTVWCGGMGKIIGYARYRRIFKQRLHTITSYDVFCEGYPNMSVSDFLESKLSKGGEFYGLNRKSFVTVISFTFFPI